ncbi:MAG: MarR family transcriptional regulator [Deltaproteobacteria bacterium]|nr:MarR family transcriptional regulator [Deltaproteobacteria bacterium]
MADIREQLQVFVRRFGLLQAASCEECCGQDVSLVQSHILSAIRSLGKPSIQQVAGELGIDITTFSRQVKRLEAKGLIHRRVSPEDRRVSLLGLTDEAAGVLGQIDRVAGTRIEQILSVLTPFERDVVVGGLARLNEAMTATGSCCTPLYSCSVQVDAANNEEKP